MKKFLLLSFIAFLFIALLTPSMGFAQSVAINKDGTAPDASAMLDIKNPNKGLLVPRVALTGTGDITTIASPAVSLLVYNTATAGTGGSTAVTPGFYYWNGALWAKIVGVTGIAGPTGQDAVNYNDFSALNGDNSAISPGQSVFFSKTNIGNSSIVRGSAPGTFVLPYIGNYEISFIVNPILNSSITDIHQGAELVVVLNGVELRQTQVGKGAAYSQLTGHCIITTSSPNSVISINNPIQSPLGALNLTPYPALAYPHLVIKFLSN